MTNQLPTSRQLERDLSQKIRALYDLEIKAPSPQKIICKIFSHYLIITEDEALSPLEKSLLEQGNTKLIQQINQEISLIVRPKLAQLIEEVVGVKAVEILNKTTPTGIRAGTLVVLSEPPKVRSSKSLPKFTVG